MAGDWIKAEHTLPDKPEVVAMAARLNIDQDAVVGKLLRLWIWADQQTVNGNGLSVTKSFIDRVTLCSGFATAMDSVGWLTGTDGKISLPNFDRHNGTTAKERASTYRRVQSHRGKKRNCNADETPPPYTPPLPETETEFNTPPPSETKTKPRMAESYPTQDAGIICVEIDGKLVHYDDNPMVWEAEFIRQWNAARDTVKHSGPALTIAHRNLLKARLSDPDWHWKLALSKFPLASETGWKPGLLWFLEATSVQNILEERHGPRKPKGKKHERQVSNPGQVYDPIAAANDPLGVNEW